MNPRQWVPGAGKLSYPKLWSQLQGHIRLRGYQSRSLVRPSDGGLEKSFVAGEVEETRISRRQCSDVAVLLAAGDDRSGSGISPKPIRGNAQLCRRLRDGAKTIVSDVAEFLLTSVSKVAITLLTLTPRSNLNSGG